MTAIHQTRRLGPEFSSGQSLHSSVEDLDGWSPWPKPLSTFNHATNSNDQFTPLRTPSLPTSTPSEAPDQTIVLKGRSPSPQWKPVTSPQDSKATTPPKPRLAPRKRRRTRETRQQTVKQKVDTKREKNRVAASKCRAKKQAWEKTLEAQARILQNDNLQLSGMLGMLKQEQLRLREMIVRHSWKCRGCSRSLLDGMGPEQLPLDLPRSRAGLPGQERYGDEDKFGFEMDEMSDVYEDNDIRSG